MHSEAFLFGFLRHQGSRKCLGAGLTAVLATRTGSEASTLELKGLIPFGDPSVPVLHQKWLHWKLLVLGTGLGFPAAFRPCGQGALSSLEKVFIPPEALCVPLDQQRVPGPLLASLVCPWVQHQTLVHTAAFIHC